MPRRKDPAMVHSSFERNVQERYYTEHWVTRALLKHLDLHKELVLEPACGRGDIVKVLQEQKVNVIASDVDLHEFDMFACACEQEDFFAEFPWWLGTHNVTAVITNPPYDKAEEFIRHALKLDVVFVAMLLRSEWNQAGTRVDLFNQSPYSFEVALTSRPRWDWWFTEDEKRERRIKAKIDPDKPDALPRHGFSWFCWDRTDREYRPTVYFESRKDNEK
jgi:hypothetical protein